MTFGYPPVSGPPRKSRPRAPPKSSPLLPTFHLYSYIYIYGYEETAESGLGTLGHDGDHMISRVLRATVVVGIAGVEALRHHSRKVGYYGTEYSTVPLLRNHYLILSASDSRHLPLPRFRFLRPPSHSSSSSLNRDEYD